MDEYTDTEIDMPVEVPDSTEYVDVEDTPIDTEDLNVDVETEIPEEIDEDIAEDTEPDTSSNENMELEEIEEDVDDSTELETNEEEAENKTDSNEQTELTKEESNDTNEEETENKTDSNKQQEITNEESDDTNEEEAENKTDSNEQTELTNEESDDTNEEETENKTDSDKQQEITNEESDDANEEETENKTDSDKQTEITNEESDDTNEEETEKKTDSNEQQELPNEESNGTNEEETETKNTTGGRIFLKEKNIPTDNESNSEIPETDFRKKLKNDVTDLARETHQNLKTPSQVQPMAYYDTTEDYKERLKNDQNLNEGFQNYLHTGVQDQAKFLRDEKKSENITTLNQVEENLKNIYQDNWRDEFRNLIIPAKKLEEIELERNARLEREGEEPIFPSTPSIAKEELSEASLENHDIPSQEKQDQKLEKIKQQKELLEQDFSPEEIEKNKEYASIYQEGKKHFQDFFKDEGLDNYLNQDVKEELEKEVEYSTIAMSADKLEKRYNDYYKDVPKEYQKEFNPNIAGYYNPEENRCYINIDINQEPAEFKSTMIHENLHRLSKSGISVADQNCQLNEGITEYLTKKVLKQEYPKDNTIYKRNTDRVELLESIVGKDKLYRAYFNRQPEILEEEFEKHLGLGSWEDFNDYCDKSVKNDNGLNYVYNTKANLMLKELDISKNLGFDYLAEFKDCNLRYADINTNPEEKRLINERLIQIEKLLQESKEIII